MYLTDEQGLSTMDNLSMSVTIGKFLRSKDYFSFRSFNIGDHFTFLIFSHA